MASKTRCASWIVCRRRFVLEALKGSTSTRPPIFAMSNPTKMLSAPQRKLFHSQ
ncbi:hypothetical protein OROMI_000988 [Orobanche minor]